LVEKKLLCFIFNKAHNIAHNTLLLYSLFSQEEELQNKLQDAKIEIKGLELLENTDHPETDMMLINFQEKDEFIEDCPFGNVVLACFTTAHKRDITVSQYCTLL
jgi:hypothetical protein